MGLIRYVLNVNNPWEYSIRKIEKKINKVEENGILFIGSSTFTLWTSLEQDLYPHKIINNGFGGAKIDDIVQNIDRILFPFNPRIIVLFIGTNDIAGKTPAAKEYVFNKYIELVTLIKAKLPLTKIHYVSITPTAARWNYWPIAHETNELIKEFSKKDKMLSFIDTTELFLDETKPNLKLFKVDKLHPNRNGYLSLAQAIKNAI